MRSRLLVTPIALALLGRVAPAHAAPAGHRPQAPAGLTVGDQARPLNVEGAPAFGWRPRDVDPGEAQSAYQIRVAAGRLAVWDSGKVASSQQSYVPYRGPALAPGESY